MKYINTRIIKSVYADEYIVQAQSNRSYNWETLVRYPSTQKAVAEIDAKNKAKKFSKEVNGLVTAYNCGGYALASYLDGEQFK